MGNIVSYLKNPSIPAAASTSTAQPRRDAQSHSNPSLAFTTSTTLKSLTGHTLSFNFSAGLHSPARPDAHPAPTAPTHPPAPTHPKNSPLLRAKPHARVPPRPRSPSSPPISPKTTHLLQTYPRNSQIIYITPGDRDRPESSSGDWNEEEGGEDQWDRERKEADEEHWAGKGVPLPNPEDLSSLWSTNEANKPLRGSWYSAESLRHLCPTCGGRQRRRMSPRTNSWEWQQEAQWKREEERKREVREKGQQKNHPWDGSQVRHIEGRYAYPPVRIATDLSEIMRNPKARRAMERARKRGREWARQRERRRESYQWDKSLLREAERSDPEEGSVQDASDLGEGVNDRVRDAGKWKVRDRVGVVDHDDSEDDSVFVPRLRTGLQHRSPKSNSNISDAFNVSSSPDSLPVPSADSLPISSPLSPLPPSPPSPVSPPSPPSPPSTSLFNLDSETIARFDTDFPPLPTPRGESLGSFPDFASLVGPDPFASEDSSRTDSLSSCSFGSALRDGARGEVGRSGSSSPGEVANVGEDPFSDAHAVLNIAAGIDDGIGRGDKNLLKRKREQHSLDQEGDEESNVRRRGRKS